MDRGGAIRTLVSEIDAYLARFAGEGVAAVRDGIARAEARAIVPVEPQAPAHVDLEAALAAAQEVPRLVAAIRAAGPELRWITYDLYRGGEIGRRFPQAHAFASFIGADAPLSVEDYELGLFVIAPQTLYRDHHHAAPELYAPLTGPHRWRFGIADTWRERPAHQPVWNRPWDVHATCVGATPFLCIFGWTRDVNIPAKTVYAADWDVIEARL